MFEKIPGNFSPEEKLVRYNKEKDSLEKDLDLLLGIAEYEHRGNNKREVTKLSTSIKKIDEEIKKVEEEMKRKDWIRQFKLRRITGRRKRNFKKEG